MLGKYSSLELHLYPWVFETGFYYVVRASLELEILLLQPPSCQPLGLGTILPAGG